MVRNLTIVLFALTLAAFLSSAVAQEGLHRDHFLGVGVRGLYADVQDPLMGEAQVDGEFGYGAMVKFAVSRRLWVQFAADVFSFTGEYSEPGFMISADLDTIPLTATLLVDLASRDSTFRPYVGAGIGYYLNNLDNVTESTFGFIVDLDEYVDFKADNGFGWHLCAGMDWFLTNNLALNLEALYRWVEYDWDAIMRPFGLRQLGEDLSGSGSDDQDGWAAIAGLTLFF